MNKFILCLLAVIFSAAISIAQSQTENATAATEKMTTFYSLTGDQVAQMQTIQERKYRNLAQIENLRTEDPTTYILKLRSLNTGHDASVRNMLTKEQRVIFDQKRMENREMMAVEYKTLKGNNASQEETNYRIIELELMKLDNH